MTIARVLLIDDDPAVLVALPETIRLWMPGAAVDLSNSGRTALDRIETTDYDAIVCDIRIPDMDGLTLLERIRTVRPATPALLITGHGDHSLAIRALRGGAYDYILKPVDREYFVNSLTRAIHMRQMSRQMEEQKAALERYAIELEQIVQARTQELRDTLELRVEERTAELRQTNEALQFEMVERQEAQKALQESQRSLHAVIETVPCLIVLTDPDGRLLLFNRMAEDLTGYRREEVMGKRIRDLFVPPQWIPTVERTLREPDAHTPHTNPWVTKSGEERLLEWRCTTLSSPHYEEPCLLGVGIDITEREATHAQITQLNAELDQQVRAYARVVHHLETSKAELHEKIQDLEKFQEVVVGRELKMMALEKQLTHLERERETHKGTQERV